MSFIPSPFHPEVIALRTGQVDFTKFDGTDKANLKHFLQHYQIYATDFQWSIEQQIDYFPLALTGKARLWFQSDAACQAIINGSAKEQAQYDQLVELVKTRYAHIALIAKDDFENASQKNGETIDHYLYRLERMLEIFEEPDLEQWISLISTKLTGAMKRKVLRKSQDGGGYSSFDELRLEMRQLEREKEEKNLVPRKITNNQNRQNYSTTRSRSSQNTRIFHGQSSSSTADHRNNRNNRNTENGHISPISQSDYDRYNHTIFTLDTFGSSRDLRTLPVKIGGHGVAVVPSTGAEDSCISEDTVKRCQLRYTPTNSIERALIKGYQGGPIVGYIYLTLKTVQFGKKMKLRVGVERNADYEMVFGLDVLSQPGVLLSGNWIRLPDSLFENRTGVNTGGKIMLL